MPPAPHVSIIITSYNSAAHLQRCFEHLAAQTFRDFEVILVDNGSYDTAVLELKGLSSYFELHIERLETNVGFARANNIGAKLARGSGLPCSTRMPIPNRIG